MTFQPPEPIYLGPASKHSGTGNKPVRRIVLHGTVSPCVPGGARNIARYFRSEAARGSAHYVVDPGEAVQVVYDSYIAWHAPPNPHSLGIELCDPVADERGKPLPLSRWDGGNYALMLKRAAELVAHLCLAYDIPVRMLGPAALKAGKRGICEHSDVSLAFGQSTHWDLGNFPRARFLRMVKAEIEALTNTEPPPPPKPSRIDKARDLLNAAFNKTSSKVRKRRIKAGLDALPKH